MSTYLSGDNVFAIVGEPGSCYRLLRSVDDVDLLVGPDVIHNQNASVLRGLSDYCWD